MHAIMYCLLFAYTILAATAAVLPSTTNGTFGSFAGYTYYPPGAQCTEYQIPIIVSIPDLKWIGPRWQSDYDLVDFVTVQSSRSPRTPLELWQNASVTGNYQVAAVFCTPQDTSKGKERTVLLASHGLWNSKE